VDYDGTKFTPKYVTMTRTTYIAITNKSDKAKMWLVSDNPALTTPRGFGLSERLTTTINEVGEFKVINKENPNAFFTVKVTDGNK
jgi:hypothetical protein